MRDPAVTPPSPALEALLKHERLPAAQPDVVRARMVSRARSAPPDVPAVPAGGATWGTGHLLLAAAAGVVIAGGVSAALHFTHRAPPAALVVKPVESPAAALPERAPTAGDLAAAVAPIPAPVAKSARHVPPASRHDALMDEVQLLGRARQADRRGDDAAVLALVAQHEGTHPDGRLIEEREVLRVKALVGLGRAADARAAAGRFRRDFPHSVLLGKIDQMTGQMVGETRATSP